MEESSSEKTVFTNSVASYPRRLESEFFLDCTSVSNSQWKVTPTITRILQYFNLGSLQRLYLTLLMFGKKNDL